MIAHPAGRPLRGVARVPGDKSISHRAAMLALLARGTSLLEWFSSAGDCRATLAAVAALGARVERTATDVVVTSTGRPCEPAMPIDCVRSGTTMRLLAGIAAGAPFETTLTGDAQLLRRPMRRVAVPLREMGATVTTSAAGTAPLAIRGGRLRGISFRPPVPSAQVKSAVLLAGLGASSETTVSEPARSRDHTERLLAWLGADIDSDLTGVSLRPHPEPFDWFELRIPGDLSSAAPLLAAAAAVAGSDVTVEGVGLNPTRTPFLDVLAAMGAEVDRDLIARSPEPVGSVRVRGHGLGAVTVSRADVPGLIDELPLLAVLAASAEGDTVVCGAAELRVKESDRIATVLGLLRTLGANVEEFEDGFRVHGPTPLRGGVVTSAGDHRVAMAAAVAALSSTAPVEIDDAACVEDSFPGFFHTLGSLR